MEASGFDEAATKAAFDMLDKNKNWQETLGISWSAVLDRFQ